MARYNYCSERVKYLARNMCNVHVHAHAQFILYPCASKRLLHGWPMTLYILHIHLYIIPCDTSSICRDIHVYIWYNKHINDMTIPKYMYFCYTSSLKTLHAILRQLLNIELSCNVCIPNRTSTFSYLSCSTWSYYVIMSILLTQYYFTHWASY